MTDFREKKLRRLQNHYTIDALFLFVIIIVLWILHFLGVNGTIQIVAAVALITLFFGYCVYKRKQMLNVFFMDEVTGGQSRLY